MPPETHPTDWPAIIAAVFAGLSGFATLAFGLYAKARQAATDQELALIKARAEAAAENAASAVKTVQESREERSGQIGQVQADMGALREEVRVHAEAANNYSGKISETAQATQAVAASTQAVAESTQKVAEEVKQMRQEFNSQPRNDY